MKNLLNFLLVIAVMVFIIGCNCKFGNMGQSEPTQNSPSQPNQPTSSQNENKSPTDNTTTTSSDPSKIGIPECDELSDYFKNKIESDNTNYITKAILRTFQEQFQESIKKSLEENKTNQEETAKFCKEFKKNLDEQEAKQGK